MISMWTVPFIFVLGFGCIITILVLIEKEADQEEQARNGKKGK